MSGGGGRLARRTVAGLVVLGLVYGGWQYGLPLLEGRARAAGPGMRMPPQTVGVATIDRGDIRIVLDALGTVTPLATVTVKTQIAGQLTQVAFTEGQLVKKGDFLAQIDPRPYQVTLEQAQAALARDQATLKGAEADLARYQKLAAQDSVARQTYEDQIATVGTERGTVLSDQASVDSAKLNLVYCHITAPTGGRVGLRQVDEGNYVQTSDANGLVVLTQLKPISVIFTLPEDNLPAIMKRVSAGATLDVTIFDRSGATKLATGKLLTLDNQIDSTTGTVKLRALFDNADESLFPNQFVNAQLLVDTMHGATIIPTAAVQRGAPGTYVYLVNADDTVSVRPVKLGPSNGERVAVKEGLAPNDMVVVDGADKLRDGAKVTLPAKEGQAKEGQAKESQSGAPQGKSESPADGQQSGRAGRAGGP
jgi:multidrug efflux system membrane fusion protein